MIPIWKNTVYTQAGSELIYTIEVLDEEIFTGKAYAYPNSNTINININKICENYLKEILPINTFTANTGSWVTTNNSYKTFVLKDNSGTTLNTYSFYWDWSYEDLSSASTQSISKPINGRYTLDMYKLQTTLSTTSVTGNYDKTAASGLGYTTSACGDYALYYINRYGGADSLLIEGNVKEKDEFNVSSFVTYLDGNVERENNRYLNEISHSYELNTGWLKDSESEILAKHLLSSNDVYLHNLKTDKIIPVDITDTSVEYKKFINGRKLVSYTINVKESNKKVIF